MPDSPAVDAHRCLIGREQIRDEMLPLVYDELRRVARGFLSRERSDHTLQPTALVHEAYLRLLDQRRVDWTNRAQLVGMAAVMMRRILVNHARDRAAAKRGGEADRVSFSQEDGVAEAPSVDLIALHDALDALDSIDPRKGRIVELRYFGGLTIAEVGDVMGLSSATIEREWSFSRAWLFDALAGGSAPVQAERGSIHLAGGESTTLPGRARDNGPAGAARRACRG